ncbi:MlaC/ttg2D family ABC transporter substrate-binding protein [Solimonas soli]|uniref:MlaC/ttg2D family ABC transporter substrate-binding protein n=1 Tax=Solimonas soli TaxID=413479 RepID=UPI0004B32EA2|nr:ABC transporter substrate-binding protein [Solimonas soli]
MNLSTRRGLIRNFAIGLVAAFGVAAGAVAATPPEQVIKTTTDALRADIGKNVAKYQADKASFYAMVDREIVPHFDTTYIAKVILGSHLKEASPEQIKQFETAFKDMLVHSYADKLLEYYDSVDIQVKPGVVQDGGKRAEVNTTIVRKDGKPPIPVTFSMRNGGDGDWKVWDIKAENISLVLNFRTQIDAEIKKSNIASVIQRLNAGQLQVDPADAKSGKAP